MGWGGHSPHSNHVPPHQQGDKKYKSQQHIQYSATFLRHLYSFREINFALLGMYVLVHVASATFGETLENSEKIKQPYCNVDPM